MKQRATKSVPEVLSVGHSTRPLEAFMGMLRAHGVQRVVDVRTVPRSRHNPQFDRDTLPAALRAAGIGYVHLPALGGLRHARPDSRNTAWRNASFRGFADYMQTPEFAAGLEALLALAARERVALMCAEAVPWRCHRSLIADALAARRIRVEHITSATRARPHALTPWARVRGGRVTYPGEPGPPAPRRAVSQRGPRNADQGGGHRPGPRSGHRSGGRPSGAAPRR
jgi:uncharacterized protein (DUF488 family)